MSIQETCGLVPDATPGSDVGTSRPDRVPTVMGVVGPIILRGPQQHPLVEQRGLSELADRQRPARPQLSVELRLCDGEACGGHQAGKLVRRRRGRRRDRPVERGDGGSEHCR